MDKYEFQSEFSLSPENFPDTVVEDRSGWPRYEHETVVETTSDNLMYLIERHNELVMFLSDKLGDD